MSNRPWVLDRRGSDRFFQTERKGLFLGKSGHGRGQDQTEARAVRRASDANGASSQLAVGKWHFLHTPLNLLRSPSLRSKRFAADHIAYVIGSIPTVKSKIFFFATLLSSGTILNARPVPFFLPSFLPVIDPPSFRLFCLPSTALARVPPRLPVATCRITSSSPPPFFFFYTLLCGQITTF